ncbi:TonB-dependent receptor [Massilibacteroides vaginae]|uniref:TonB-dependent receptor n=1 Tax=Massilibacteroides vaginae TaxID=1673718 RepID=UPI000A1CCCC5|nr:TonB-dependent receptor [Massilibacteroides vaginae]
MNKIKIFLNKRIVFLSYALLFTLVCNINAQKTPEKITLSFSEIELSDAIGRIQATSSYTFFYDVNKTDLTQKVSLNINQKGIEEVMTALLSSTNLTFEITNKQIALMPKPVQTKLKKITGTILDNSGESVIGANVSVKGTTIGTITDMDGKFSLDVPESGVLLVSYIGYNSFEERLNNKKTFDITLTEDTKALDEIVVVGYGTSRKRDIVSAMANVKGTAFSSASTSNVKDVLQGKVAGVDVQSARFPGDDQGILIRGSRSLNAGNNPLIIVDGIPGSLSNINTYDIESIEVLKDAASSAIYGSMGANGVVLVTTKRAKSGVKREVSFNAYMGLNVPHMMPLQSGEEYVQFRRDGYRYAHGWDKPFTDEDVFTASELDVINKGEYTNWQDLMYRDALTQSYHLSVGNSGEKTKLFLSLKYDKEEGYYETNDMENINISLTTDHELASFWKLGTTVRLRRNNVSDFRLSHKDRQENTEVLYMTPLSRPYHDDGTINYFPNPLNTSGYNPLSDYVPGQYADDKQRNTLNLNFTSNITITKWLNMQTNAGFTFSDNKTGYFYGKNAYFNKGVKTVSGKDYSNSDQYTINNIISYDNTFGDHHLAVDLVGEIQSYKYDLSNLSGNNQPVEYTTYHNLASNTENIKINSTYEDWALASGLVRARYNYKSKYFLNVAIRADGSSRLAKGNQWAYFPSGGLGWSIKDEAFLAETDWVDNLKLRLSYGTVGNTAINPYETQARLSQKAYLFGEDAADKFYTYSPSSIVNLNLGWEISKTVNAGIDFGFFNNKLTGYVEVYQTRTDDLLMKRAIPTFSGFDMIWQNIGKTENKGLEIGLNYSPIRSKDLNVDLSFNSARNWEKILELISGEDLPNNRWFIGKPMGVIYDYEKIGVWQLGEETEAAKYNAKPGDIKVKDQDGDGSISAANDRVILGQTRPKWTASLGGNIQYKAFDFSFNINSRWGYMVKAIPYNDITMDGQRWLPSVDYWTPDNPTNDFPRADQASGYDTYRGANGYQKGDHIKLQDITFGYSFDKLLSKYIPVQKTRLYFQMRNIGYLYRATKYDIIPEAPNFNFTVASSYNFGVNITF